MNEVCPQCGHEFESQEQKTTKKPPKKVRHQTDESTCIQCRKPISGKPLSFGGGFSCESCVCKYYGRQGAEVQAREVRERKAEAVRILSQRSKA